MADSPLASTASDPLNGRVVLGRYRIIRPLGQGGTGVVHFGRTEGAAGFAKPVVVKRVLPQLLRDPVMSQMLIREARILANLQHRGIVGVVDLGEENGAYIMVLEYVHGYDLGQWLKYLRRREQRLPIDVSLEIGIRVLEALHYAHTLTRTDGVVTEVIHRDISPANVLLDVEGNVRILDFGIARIANDMTEFATKKNTFKGKVGYSHPSLLELDEPTALTDVYSAALVTFQLLAGQNPMYGSSTADTIRRIRTLPTPKLRDFRPEVSPALEAVFTKALSKKSQDCYQSAQLLADALRERQTTPVSDITAQLSEWVRRDFLGEMPEVLGIEPLAARDAAWRTFERELRHSQSAPGEDEVTPVADQSLQRQLAIASEEATSIQGRGGLHAQRGLEEPTVVGPLHLTRSATVTHSADAKFTLPPMSARTHQRPLLFLLGLLSLAILTVAFVLLLRKEPKVPESRYLIISHDTSAATSAEALPATAPAATVTDNRVSGAAVSSGSATPEPGANQPAKPTKSREGGPREPDPQLFTQRFGRKQGQVQSCFTRNAGQGKDVRFEIRFQVDAAGHVTQAALTPSNLSSTPLGQCLLQVARTTQFGALTSSASFRIPVTASVK